MKILYFVALILIAMNYLCMCEKNAFPIKKSGRSLFGCKGIKI